MDVIKSADLFGAIEKCLTQEPPKDGLILSKDASLLADILGGMIARGVREVSLQVLEGEHLEAFMRWRNQP